MDVRSDCWRIDMTKYHIKINKDWNYDDLVGEEVLLFSSPDDFSFYDIEKIRECLIELGYLATSICETDFVMAETGKPAKSVKCKKGRYWHEFFSLDMILDYDTEERKSLITVLDELFDVKLLNYDEI